MSPDSGACSILVARCCRIPVPPGFQQSSIVGFQQSDIKRTCNNEEFNSKKRFTVLKTVNRFQKLRKLLPSN
jgi:hypothetical protein